MAVGRMESESWWMIFIRTFPSFQHSVQDVQVYLLQELQCKDFLAAMKQNHPCIKEKYQVMNWHILMKKRLTAITWTEEDSRCSHKGVTATEMPHLHPCLHHHRRHQLCLLPANCQKKEKKRKLLHCLHLCYCSTFVQKHGESSPVHVTDVSYFLIKMCQFIAWDLS